MKHGDLTSPGDEFNRKPWYYCGKCRGSHGRDIAQCDGLRETPVNGTFSWERFPVPTGVVPRRDHYAESLERGKRVGQLIDSMNAGAKAGDLNPATLRPYPPDHPEQTTRTLPDFGVHGAAIQQAVDDYLLMERKARALDDIRRQLQGCDMQLWVDEIDRLVHPAQSSAPADR